MDQATDYISNGAWGGNDPKDFLEFEKPMAELEIKIRELKSSSDDSAENIKEIRSLQSQLKEITEEIYGKLSPWQTVQVARHKDRPHTIDYLSLVFDEFIELHGDKLFGDDRAIRVGFARLGNQKVMVLGHEKGRNLKERSANFFGCAHPEGYRKAMSKMRMAAKFNLPVICMIDTPGAYPGIGAEERGQAQVIAENMFEMSRLETPVICVVIGEGGSGGALGIGVGDKVAMLKNSYYSVISPEGCAGILWKGAEHAEKAAEALKFTSSYLLDFGVVDDVIEEPLGGAHRDPHNMAANLRNYLKKNIEELQKKPTEELLDGRYERFRKLGVFFEHSE
jgi:acetyl-CoA carboxylase carboxyl transferase subunit alpha